MCKTRPLASLLWLFLLFILLVGQAHGSRNSQVFKVRPIKSQNSSGHDNFSGFLPKGMPIPPSGPSKKHNDIGLQTSQKSPWKWTTFTLRNYRSETAILHLSYTIWFWFVLFPFFFHLLISIRNIYSSSHLDRGGWFSFWLSDMESGKVLRVYSLSRKM